MSTHENEDRLFILDEIKRLAGEKSGKPPGRESFRQKTGIPAHRWLGVYWTSWSNALAEAGFEPNLLAVAFDKDLLLENLVGAIRHLKKFPTDAELTLYARNVGIPNAKAYQRHFKTKGGLARALAEFCVGKGEMADVIDYCGQRLIREQKSGPRKAESKLGIKGYVYLMHSGKYYRIGRSNHVGRREYQHSLKLPETISTVHSIATDDPVGIEAYWHKRFQPKKAKGDWFSLNAEDVRAFKARTFM